MNKTDLVRKVAESFETKKEAQKAVDSVLDAFMSSLEKGNDIVLVGFGSFKIVNRQERKGRNPQTGEEITISARNTVKFSPGKILKEAVN